MSIKRVSDLELVGIDGIDDEKSTEKPFTLSRMEVSEAENDVGSKFTSKGYTIEALCKAFGNNIMKIPNIWHDSQTYLSSVIIQHPGYLSSNGNTYLHGTETTNISADFQNVEFHLNDRKCVEKNVSISSAQLYLGSARNASLSAGNGLSLSAQRGNVEIRSPKQVNITAGNSVNVKVGDNSLTIDETGIHIAGNVDFDIGNEQTFRITNKSEDIEDILSCNSDGGVSTHTTKENPFICYAQHALWS